MCVLEAGYSDFVGRCAVGRAVFNGFRKLLCSSKLYITAVILFSCIYTGFGGINGYLMRQGQTVQAGELFVFGMDSWIPQLIITVAFLILVNDIPFGKSGAQLQLIRSSRSRWLLGQTLSGFSTAAVYLILVELLFVVTTVRNLSFSDEWSQPVILAARLGKCTAIGIETAVRFPMSVLMNKSAWAVFGVGTGSITFEVHIPLRRGKYFCTTDNCGKCDIHCTVFLSSRLDTMACSQAPDGAGGLVATK